jgi:hypothetical protein
VPIAVSPGDPVSRLRRAMIDTLNLILLALIAGLLWALVSRQRMLEERLARLDRLEEIRAAVQRIAGSGEALDLRRLEHVLIDMRDGQKRLEERLVGLAEVSRKEASRDPEVAAPRAPERPTAAGLIERLHGRLMAMGYERIELLTTSEEIAGILEAGGEGEVRVEARRDGATRKGRVRLSGGVISAVELQGSHAMFP